MTSHAKAEGTRKKAFVRPVLMHYGTLSRITLGSTDYVHEETHQEVIITRHGFGKWK